MEEGRGKGGRGGPRGGEAEGEGAMRPEDNGYGEEPEEKMRGGGCGESHGPIKRECGRREALMIPPLCYPPPPSHPLSHHAGACGVRMAAHHPAGECDACMTPPLPSLVQGPAESEWLRIIRQGSVMRA